MICFVFTSLYVQLKYKQLIFHKDNLSLVALLQVLSEPVGDSSFCAWVV